MASLVSDQNGRQRRISTKETKNKKALKIAEEFEPKAFHKRFRQWLGLGCNESRR
jgi:hypothetical protein